LSAGEIQPVAAANYDRHISGQRGDYAALGQSLKNRWDELCARYLPIVAEGSVWRQNRLIFPDDPEQGWKLHISATILTANQIMEKVAPLLCSLNIVFKAPRSLEELSMLNCGLQYGFSQVGKFITVYPKTPEDAMSLAQKLHRLTYRLPGPSAPYDISFRANSRVSYRYGSFSFLEVENANGARVSAIRKPDGELIPDLREPGAAAPVWATNPFLEPIARSGNKSKSPGPLKTTYRAYEALSQRGKGGVYRALDLSVLPARLCVLKEGRRHGETDWDGRDGYWRIKREARVLSSLYSAGVRVPRVYATFKSEGNFYLAAEFIEGKNLQSLLMNKRKKLPLPEALDYGAQLAALLQQIHSAGWTWRDCKPLNLIVDDEGRLRPLDFEGACPVNQPDKMPWGTPGYAPPDWLSEPVSKTRVPEDLYALGATLHQLLSNDTPYGTHSKPAIGRLRKHVPAQVKELLSALLDADPASRPAADRALGVLKAAGLKIGAQN
jgi:class IV lanthipeptide synthase